MITKVSLCNLLEIELKANSRGLKLELQGELERFKTRNTNRTKSELERFETRNTNRTKIELERFETRNANRTISHNGGCSSAINITFL